MGIKTFYNWLRMAAISLLLTIGLLRTADAQNYNTYKSLPKSNGKHTITGRYREENGKFILSDIHFEGGISMTQTPSQIVGTYDEDESSVTFRFDNITLPCRLSSLNQKLFKILDDGGKNEWQSESEFKQKQQSRTSVSSVIVMLQLDCSESLGRDFVKVKNAAKNFIRTLAQASTDGNIHLGFIGFASQGFINKNQLPPVPLTGNSAERIISFIDNLGQSNNTAIYQAINTGYDIATKYYTETLKSPSFFNGLYMVTFTDGQDNESRIDGIGGQKCLEAVKRKLKAGFYGKRLESYVVGVKGNDINNEYEFHRALQQLASNDDYYVKLENIDAVQDAFQEIANSLVSNTQTLSCTTAVGNQGWLQWVLDCYDAPSAPTPTSTPEPEKSIRPKSYWGIDATWGAGMLTSTVGLRAKIRYKELGAALELGYTQIAGLSAYWQPSIIRNQKHDFSWYIGVHGSAGMYGEHVNPQIVAASSQPVFLDFQGILGIEYSYKRFNTELSIRSGIRDQALAFLHVGVRFDWNK